MDFSVIVVFVESTKLVIILYSPSISNLQFVVKDKDNSSV